MITSISPNTIILHRVPVGESAALPRPFASRRVAEVWTVVNECALRTCGPIDRHNANRQDAGRDWQQYGDRLSCFLKDPRGEIDLFLVFAPESCPAGTGSSDRQPLP